MKHLNLFFIFLIFCTMAHAQVDPLNTYQWNRKNYFSKNGRIDEKPWFEWWYYKVVLPETKESFYFVYGAVNPWDKTNKLKGTRSYVGMGDFKAKKIVDKKHDLSEFKADYHDVKIQVGEHQATDQWLKGHLQDENKNNYAWEISVHKKWSFPGTGWAIGKNITSIEWYPAQADATCSGWVHSAGQLRQFVNAPCYQDRNWGELFPEWWTWIVSNHFEGHPDTALVIGGGRPHVYGIDIGMESVVVGLKHKGVEYAFRPNDFDTLKIDIRFGKWLVWANNRNYKLEIEASAPKEDFMDLQFMTPNGSIFHDYEALTGTVTIHLYKKKGIFPDSWALVETLRSSAAGIEYGSENLNEFQKLFTQQKTLFFSQKSRK